MKKLPLLLVIILVISNNIYSQNLLSESKVKPKSKLIATTIGITNWVLPPVLGYYLEEDGRYNLAEWVVWYGILAGPAMGNYYAGDMKRFYIGFGVRAAVFSAFITVLNDQPNDEHYAIAMTSIFAVSSIWNIWTAPKSVQEYNDKHFNLSLAPCYMPQNRSAGIGLTLNF